MNQEWNRFIVFDVSTLKIYLFNVQVCDIMKEVFIFR